MVITRGIHKNSFFWAFLRGSKKNETLCFSTKFLTSKWTFVTVKRVQNLVGTHWKFVTKMCHWVCSAIWCAVVHHSSSNLARNLMLIHCSTHWLNTPTVDFCFVQSFCPCLCCSQIALQCITTNEQVITDELVTTFQRCLHWSQGKWPSWSCTTLLHKVWATFDPIAVTELWFSTEK